MLLADDVCRRSNDAAHGGVSRRRPFSPADGGRAAPQGPEQTGCTAERAHRHQPQNMLRPELHETCDSSVAAGTSVAWSEAGTLPDLNLSPPSEAADNTATRQWTSMPAADGNDAHSQTLLDSLAGAAISLAAEQSGTIM